MTGGPGGAARFLPQDARSESSIVLAVCTSYIALTVASTGTGAADWLRRAASARYTAARRSFVFTIAAWGGGLRVVENARPVRCDRHARMEGTAGVGQAARTPFCRTHKLLRVTLALAAGIADRVWEIGDLLAA